MNVTVMEDVFRRVSAKQGRFDHTQHPDKLAAKARAIALLSERVRKGGRILDVGGESFYQAPLVERYELTTLNLPDDMHDMAFEGVFEGAMAMHVLEHSPAPLFVLSLLHQAIVPGGWLYVAVPKPCGKFCRNYGHMSVLPDPMWRTLLEVAGFTLVHAESGKFGWRKRWVEHRYLAERTA